MFGRLWTERRLHGAAPPVAHHHDELRSKMTDCILDAAQHTGCGDITGLPDYEQVADAKVESDLWRNSGIGATQDDCKWLLGTGTFFSARDGLINVFRFGAGAYPWWVSRISHIPTSQSRERVAGDRPASGLRRQEQCEREQKER
jgi:hypothetical protein